MTGGGKAAERTSPQAVAYSYARAMHVLLQHAPDPYASVPRMPLSQRVPDAHVESDEEDGEESQMFPGSDLF